MRKQLGSDPILISTDGQIRAMEEVRLLRDQAPRYSQVKAILGLDSAERKAAEINHENAVALWHRVYVWFSHPPVSG